MIYAAVTTGKIINRGFLNGPVCPIYGFGMVGVLLLLRPFNDRLVLLFFTGMLLCSLIELIGGWALEKFFHTRWWDYSMRPLNIGGYVCLGFSIIWGFGVVFVIRLVHPIILYSVDALPKTLPMLLVWGIIALLYLLFVTDLLLTLQTIIGLQRKLAELEKIAAALHGFSDNVSQKLGQSALNADARLEELKAAGSARLEVEKADVLDGIAVLEERKQQLEQSIALQRSRLSEAAAGQKQRASEKLDQLETNLSELVDRLEGELLQVETRLNDAKARMLEQLPQGEKSEKAEKGEKNGRINGAEWTRRLHSLETRRNELLRSINASPFGARRLTGAFPALQRALHARVTPAAHTPAQDDSKDPE